MWVHTSPKETVPLIGWDYISIFLFANFLHIKSDCIYCMFFPCNLLIFTVYIGFFNYFFPQLFLFPTYSNQKKQVPAANFFHHTSIQDTFHFLSPFANLFPSGQLDAEPQSMKMPWHMLYSPLWTFQLIFSCPGVAPVSASKFPTQVGEIRWDCTDPTDSSRDGWEAEVLQILMVPSLHCPFQLWQTFQPLALIQNGLKSHQNLSRSHVKDTPQGNTVLPIMLQVRSALSTGYNYSVHIKCTQASCMYAYITDSQMS